jgi:hypothetical protein
MYRMRKTFKNFLSLKLVFILLLFVNSCKDDDLLDNQHNHVHGTKSRMIKGKEAEEIGNMVFNSLSQKNEAGKMSKGNKSMSSSELGTVKYDEILEVIDDNGEKNYTLRIEDQPEDTEKTFYNLVVNKTEDTPKMYVNKYTMSDSYYSKYSQTESFNNFQGTVGIKDIGIAGADCDEIIIPINGNINNNNPGDGPGNLGPGGGLGNGGTGGLGTGGNSNPSGTGNSFGGSSGCYSVYTEISCSCGRSYGDWASYGSSVCGTYTGSQTYTVTLTITIEANPFCRMGKTASDCTPIGDIGILPEDENTNPCEELSNKELTQAFNDQMQSLKNKAATQGYESAHVLYMNAVEGLLISAEFTGDPNAQGKGREVDLSLATSYAGATPTNCVGFIHNHLDDGTTFKVFSLSDLVALAKLANYSTRPTKEFAMYVVTSSGTFAMTINDRILLKDNLLFMEVMQSSADWEKKFEGFVNMSQTVEEQTLGLLLFMNEMQLINNQNNSKPFKLHKKNETNNSWETLELSDDQKSINTKPCNN